MALAGQYPIVRGSTTLSRFFETLARQATPPKPFAMKKWLTASSLASSYFSDVASFARFVGLIDNEGPTPLWSQLRDDDQRDSRLLEALRAAYAGPLDFLAIDAPTRSEVQRIASYIRTHEGVASAEAEGAAETLVSAFDTAMHRASGAEPTTPGTRTRPSTAGIERKPAGKPAASQAAKDRGREQANPRSGPVGFTASLAVNLQIVLPPDAPDEKYDAMLGAVARHLGNLLTSS